MGTDIKYYSCCFSCFDIYPLLDLLLKHYKATKLYENREYEAAAEAFDEIGHYKDSILMKYECEEKIQND